MALLVIHNANPLRRRTGDCVYRALSRFLCISWREALDSLVRWAADRGLTNFNFRSTYTASAPSPVTGNALDIFNNKKYDK